MSDCEHDWTTSFESGKRYCAHCLTDKPEETEPRHKVDVLQFAQILEQSFQLRFNRNWNDLPEADRNEWLQAAKEIILEMDWEPEEDEK